MCGHFLECHRSGGESTRRSKASQPYKITPRTPRRGPWTCKLDRSMGEGKPKWLADADAAEKASPQFRRSHMHMLVCPTLQLVSRNGQLLSVRARPSPWLPRACDISYDVRFQYRPSFKGNSSDCYGIQMSLLSYRVPGKSRPLLGWPPYHEGGWTSKRRAPLALRFGQAEIDGGLLRDIKGEKIRTLSSSLPPSFSLDGFCDVRPQLHWKNLCPTPWRWTPRTESSSAAMGEG